MKKTILILSFSVIIAVSGLIPSLAQEQPKPQKDTVNMDTDAKPTFYYPIEDEKTNGDKGTGKNSTGLIAIIVGAVVAVGAAGFFLLKKKK
ncbi:MAG: LPXTG cell wall anchor domain-containing protein [Bacteroidales bacterium]|nr:LPXTG cell wall anchor domain-containing protein [Bacteroidales bacterium]